MSSLPEKNLRSRAQINAHSLRAPRSPGDKEAKAALRPAAGNRHFHPSDWHALSRLMLAAIEGVIDLVEALHRHILPGILARGMAGRVTNFTYRKLRSTTGAAGRWCDAWLGDRKDLSLPAPSSANREATLAALNGIVGDFLAASGNPLAIRMQLRINGRPLTLQRSALKAALPGAGGKLLVLVHGLCRCDLQWRRGGHDHGSALTHDLGYTPLYLHYNSGLHISTNGNEFASLLENLVHQWPCPIEELVILAHSMGGLVARSACHYGKLAGHEWPGHLKHMVFLGTPHHGAPLERGGNWLTVVLGRSAYTAPFARLGQIRSAGITDLRYGNLLQEDWEGRDRFEHAGDSRRPVPLPKGVKCYAVAGTTGRRAGDIRSRVLGDGLVPLATALGQHQQPSRMLKFPKSRQWIAYGIHHLDLVGRREVYEKIKEWLAAGDNQT